MPAIESLKKFLQALRASLRHERIVLIGAAVGLALILTPLQHYIKLARWQHFAIGLGIVSIATAIQLGASWKRASTWSRMSLIWLCAMMGVMTRFFWMNPWLGNPDLATSTEQWDAQIFAVIMVLIAVLFLLVTLGFWMSKLMGTPSGSHKE